MFHIRLPIRGAWGSRRRGCIGNPYKPSLIAAGVQQYSHHYLLSSSPLDIRNKNQYRRPCVFSVVRIDPSSTFYLAIRQKKDQSSKFRRYTVQYARLDLRLTRSSVHGSYCSNQCSRSGSVSFWASRSRNICTDPQSASFHHQAK